MEKLRLAYEHLMLKAFACKRGEYYFANADAYDGAANRLDETRTLILCALVNLKNNGADVERYIQRISSSQLLGAKEPCTLEVLNEVLEGMSDEGIV